MKKTTVEIENQLTQAKSRDDLEKILKNLPQVTFRTRMEELCEKYGRKITATAELAGIAVSTFYAILNKERPAHKDQLIKVSFILGTTLEELNELLKLAGLKELYAKNKEDAIVRYGKEHGLTISEVDELLEANNCVLRFEEFRD